MQIVFRILVLQLTIVAFTPCNAFTTLFTNIKSFGRRQRNFENMSSLGSNSFAERIESIKSGIVAGVAGSISFAPFALLSGAIQSNHFDGQWEFNHDMFAITIGLFGITYRYAVRDSVNPQLKYGVIGAFSLTRLLNLIIVPNYCSSIPLNCGPPFYYFSLDMVGQGILYGTESAIGFWGASIVLDYFFSKGFIKKFKE